MLTLIGTEIKRVSILFKAKYMILKNSTIINVNKYSDLHHLQPAAIRIILLRHGRLFSQAGINKDLHFLEMTIAG